MYERIVVGTDGSKRALEAVRTAARLAELCGAGTLHVVAGCHVFSAFEVERIQSQLPREFHDLIDPHIEAVDRFVEARDIAGPSIEIVPHEVSGDPADGILTVAESVDADLIVVGARGLGALGRFIRGSVSTRVAQHSPCDVLIVEHDS